MWFDQRFYPMVWKKPAFLLLPQERSLGTACFPHSGFQTGSEGGKKKCRWQNPLKQQQEQQVTRGEAHLLYKVLKDLWLPEEVAEETKWSWRAESEVQPHGAPQALGEALHQHLLIDIFLFFLFPRQLAQSKLKGQRFSTDAAMLTA